MGQEVNISITNVSLLNDKNILNVDVMLENIWSNIIQFPYILINVQIDIPVLEGQNEGTIIYTIVREYKVSLILESEKHIPITEEFIGNVNTAKQTRGFCSVIGYQKIYEDV